MAIKTPANLTPPPNSVEPQGEGVKLYRIWERHVIDDGQGEVNFADTVCKLNDPLSGESLNVNVVSGGATPTVDTNSLSLDELLTSNTKNLFSIDFNGGLDTYFDWVIAFEGGFEPVSRNASVLSASASIGPADISLGRLPIIVGAASPLGDVYKLISNNYLKIPKSGKNYFVFSKVFEPTSINVTDIQLRFSSTSSINVFLQSQWNIDTFGAGVLNPSAITLDFTKVQSFIIEISYNNTAKVGFIINDANNNNNIYFAHKFVITNTLSSIEYGNLNLPAFDGVEIITDTIIATTGFFDGDSGVALQAVTDTTASPFANETYYLNSCFGFSIGASDIDVRSPFSLGNENSYVNVTSEDTLLFSFRPRLNLHTGVFNRTVFNIDSVSIATKSPDLQSAALIEIYWNPLISGTDYNNINPYSGLEINTVDTGSNLTNAIKIASIIVNANQNITISKEDILKEYKNAYSIKETKFDGLSIENLDRGTIAVFASPMTGTTEIDVSVNINGGEVA